MCSSSKHHHRYAEHPKRDQYEFAREGRGERDQGYTWRGEVKRHTLVLERWLEGYLIHCQNHSWRISSTSKQSWLFPFSPRHENLLIELPISNNKFLSFEVDFVLSLPLLWRWLGLYGPPFHLLSPPPRIWGDRLLCLHGCCGSSPILLPLLPPPSSLLPPPSSSPPLLLSSSPPLLLSSSHTFINFFTLVCFNQGCYLMHAIN